MKIAFNPSTVAALITPPNNKDITFDLRGRNIFARGVKFCGTDTWRDIKINNVSIGSNILDLRNGSNTTLTNTNGVVTINSTWRPVVDNLTSDSTTSSLSANLGRVLVGLINGKSDSGHNHDGRYVRAFGTSNDNIDSDWGQSFKTFDPIPSGTPPEKNPNISLLSIGENFSRRKLLAFIYSNDNIYYRRHTEDGFSNWRRLAFANEIPTSLKNPYALTISLNGISLGPYDGSAAKNINITPGSIGAAVSNHSHDYLVVNTADDKSFNSAYHNFLVLYAGGDNGIAGRPLGVDAFGLIRFRAAYGWSGQMLLANGGSLYIRSSEDALMTNTLAWKTILDSSNYSGILDSRYYTKLEVNTKLGTYLPLSGGTVTGNIILKGGTSADMTYAGNVHPYIRFDNSDSSLNVSLIFTDYDTYRRPAGIKLVGNQGNEWFEAANIYATTFYGALSGNASSANKLTTARNIALGTDLRGSANFDGSSNITISANINACTVQVSSTNGLPFKRIAHFETGSSWNDNALLLYISLGYINGSNGICRVEFRTNNISSSSTSVTASAAVRWLVRNGYGLDSLYAGYYVTTSKAYIDIYLKTTSSYQGTVIRVLLDSRGGINSNVLLINSYYYSDTNHKEAYNSIEAASTVLYNRAYTRIVSGSDVGTVSYSNSTGSVHWNNVTNKPSEFNPTAHTHTVFKNNLMIKGTNGVSDNASIHLSIGDSDTGFKWISDGKCLIYANNVAVGEWTSGGMNWFKNPTVNGNKVWNAGNDGSGSGLDADTVDGYHATSGRTFNGNINWSDNWNDTWSDGTNKHPWYGFDHRYPNTGAYSTTISDYFGMTIKTANTLRLDFGTLLLNGTSIYSINVASATKLQTARKIWGQSFDGTGDVSGSLSGVGHIQFSTDKAYDIGSNSAASRYIYTYWLGAKSGLKLELGANNSGYGLGLCIDTNLNVGIGTSTPTYKLDVVGNIRATGNSYATHFYESSDKTLKKNIKSILSSTNIPKIREFDWKDTGEHSYGFIALELEELGYGCLVSEVNGKKTVNYTATLALTVAKLLNLINIQNKKISNLTKELKALKYGRKKNS